MIQKLLNNFGAEKVTKWSIAQRPEWIDIMVSILHECGPFNTILEIGTFRGVTAALLSYFCKKVITVDVREQPETKVFLNYLSITNVEVIVKKSNEVRDFILNQTFDFAFIDGNHSSPYPKNDFEAVKKCGIVLFHDYFLDKRFPGVNEAVDSLDDIEIIEPFAFWRKK